MVVNLFPVPIEFYQCAIVACLMIVAVVGILFAIRVLKDRGLPLG